MSIIAAKAGDYTNRILLSSAYAWDYGSYGMSDFHGLSNTQFAVRPVTLFKLELQSQHNL